MFGDGHRLRGIGHSYQNTFWSDYWARPPLIPEHSAGIGAGTDLPLAVGLKCRHSSRTPPSSSKCLGMARLERTQELREGQPRGLVIFKTLSFSD